MLPAARTHSTVQSTAGGDLLKTGGLFSFSRTTIGLQPGQEGKQVEIGQAQQSL